jgi:hypothetical protein
MYEIICVLFAFDLLPNWMGPFLVITTIAPSFFLGLAIERRIAKKTVEERNLLLHSLIYVIPIGSALIGSFFLWFLIISLFSFTWIALRIVKGISSICHLQT